MNIYLENVIKEYEGKKIVEVDELHIKSGALYGFIGPNGAGKSTLIKMIAGLERLNSGNIYYGHKPKSDPPFEIMTLVFQKPYLLRTTVEKNILYPLKLRGWSEKEMEDRVTELLKDMGLSEFRHQKSWKLSGGETQKVALARAMSFRPKLLLLDEPTANIDPSTIAIIEKMLRKANQEENTTVIIITHNLQQAKRLCSDLVFMHKGDVVEHGSADEVLNQPKHILTQRFIEGELIID